MLKKKKGLILVISAPSGAGKTTLCKRLLQASSSFISSVSFTTRRPRKNEIEGVDYYFVSQKEFQKMIEKRRFIEWTEVHGRLYGTSVKLLDQAIKEEKDVLLEVDVTGGAEIKKNYPQAVLIFLLPPSWQELEKRLANRRTEDEEKLARRIKQAKREIKYAPHYDYFIVNDDINRALEDLLAIIQAERCRMDRVAEEKLEGPKSPKN
ncbi:guanylate kinase [Candidatus Aerophobetes bacterium]|uniref:Guanylate kinase n=1 Tax=Aerophobetes bacterium TaxID=2030807 RepID=A0A523UTX0_UNCAE|nr:MAG: guanylate kinase [Candidatus Aerophobetes bacterium]